VASKNDLFYQRKVSDKMDISKETISRLRHRGYNDETVFLCSCYRGCIETVKWMIDEKGVKNWNRGLEWACCHGHMNIVKLMIEKGANNLIPLDLPLLKNNYNH
jgi:hypothetical protein